MTTEQQAEAQSRLTSSDTWDRGWKFTQRVSVPVTKHFTTLEVRMMKIIAHERQTSLFNVAKEILQDEAYKAITQKGIKVELE